ncbi:hypothetical protein GMDG_03785 [Pseudogymnoascus destructans 20631-21]|uniref:Retrotransposon gag domain-containing protein n=1 Tax=Pseudogymnoascus destructans (strain ATCC MYA-4855 / 20631-21) TaxID=658429 RepID=L8GB13_PSED2|nr:hypothetical protein GMDG_03785 [Pseudogymnoascus destructans 20631-21]
MEAPFAGATTRSRSQNQDVTQTIRGDSPQPRERSPLASSGGYGQERDAGDSSEGLTDPPSDLDEKVEEGRRAVDRLEQQVREARATKKRAVESRIAELELQELRKERLEQELQELLHGLLPGKARKQPGSAIAGGDDAEGALDGASSISGDSVADRRHRSRKAPRFRDLPIFRGKNLREAQSFVAGADRRFRIDDGLQYATDQNKIDYCVLAFGPGPAAKWERYERREGLGSTTWGKFKEWMMDSILDPSNRVFDTIMSYNAAKQGETQSAEDFAAYLDTLELELRIDEEKLRKNNLYAKL